MKIFFSFLLALFVSFSTFSQETIIPSPDKTSFGIDDAFGYSVSVFGDRLIVGAINDETSLGETGAAYIYKFDTNNWVLEEKLESPDLTFNASFGYKVDLYNNTAFVSAIRDNNSGAVYVFELVGEKWVQTAKLVSSDIQTSDNFGYSISAYKDEIIVSNNRQDGADRNYAYVFKKENNNWNETMKLITSEGSGTRGYKVSLYDDRIALADARYFDNISGVDGATYIFKRENNLWNEEDVIYNYDKDIENFGQSVAIADNLVVITSIYDTLIYEFENNVWILKSTFSKPKEPAKNYGAGVSIHEDKIIVGSLEEEATLYSRTSDSWFLEKVFEASDRDFFPDYYGLNSVDIYKGNLVLGARNRDSDNIVGSGAVYVYDLDKVLSVDENIDRQKISFYPNPTQDKINFTNFSLSNISTVEIYSVNGQKIASHIFDKQIDVSFLPSGIYLMKIVSDSGYTSKSKIIKK